MAKFPRLSGVLLSSLLLFSSAEKSVFAWSHYGADAANTKFAPLTQIDSTNFAELRIIWRRPLPDVEILETAGIESDSHRSTPFGWADNFDNGEVTRLLRQWEAKSRPGATR